VIPSRNASAITIKATPAAVTINGKTAAKVARKHVTKNGETEALAYQTSFLPPEPLTPLILRCLADVCGMRLILSIAQNIPTPPQPMPLHTPSLISPPLALTVPDTTPLHHML
jgi:hypothetical protein